MSTAAFLKLRAAFAFLVVLPEGNLRLLLSLLLPLPLSLLVLRRHPERSSCRRPRQGPLYLPLHLPSLLPSPLPLFPNSGVPSMAPLPRVALLPQHHIALPQISPATVQTETDQSLRHHPHTPLRARLQPCQHRLRRTTALAAEILLPISVVILIAAAPLPLRAQQDPQQTVPPAMPMSMPLANPQPTTGFPPITPPTNLLTEAQTRPPITLDELLTHALTTSPTLAQSRAQTTRTQALARQASLYPNPTIGYQGDQIRGGSYGGGEQGAYLAQTIPLGGKLTLRRKALEAEAHSNEATTATTQTTLRNEITQAFYAALAAQQTTQIRRNLLEVAEDATRTAHQLANIGQAEATDILATEVEQEQATMADTQAQHLYLARFHILATLANNPSLPLSPLTGDLATLPRAPTLDQVLQTSPALAEARTRITAAEARLTAAQHDNIPDLQLKAGEQYSFEQLSPGSLPGKVGPQSFASADITLPIWNRNQGNIAAAKADLEAARQNLRALQLSIQQQAQPLLEAYAAATQQATLYRTSILPRATRATQLYEQKYNQMAQSYPQVLASRRTLLTLQLQYTQTLTTLWHAATALQYGVLTRMGSYPVGLPSIAQTSAAEVD